MPTHREWFRVYAVARRLGVPHKAGGFGGDSADAVFFVAARRVCHSLIHSGAAALCVVLLPPSIGNGPSGSSLFAVDSTRCRFARSLDRSVTKGGRFSRNRRFACPPVIARSRAFFANGEKGVPIDRGERRLGSAQGGHRRRRPRGGGSSRPPAKTRVTTHRLSACIDGEFFVPCSRSGSFSLGSFFFPDSTANNKLLIIAIASPSAAPSSRSDPIRSTRPATAAIVEHKKPPRERNAHLRRCYAVRSSRSPPPPAVSDSPVHRFHDPSPQYQPSWSRL